MIAFIDTPGQTPHPSAVAIPCGAEVLLAGHFLPRDVCEKLSCGALVGNDWHGRWAHVSGLASEPSVDVGAARRAGVGT